MADPNNPWDNYKKNNKNNDVGLDKLINEAGSIFKNFKKNLNKNNKNNNTTPKKIIPLVVVGVVIVWLLSGLYRVNPDEQGVELLFGKYVRTTSSGLNYWLPYPIGRVIKPSVTQTQQLNIDGNDRDSLYMLTGDQNIIDLDFNVQWRIGNAGYFLFNTRNPVYLLKTAAESTMREIVGQATLESIMTTGRADLVNKSEILLQEIMDSYKSGITILGVKLQKADPPSDVIDAFNDVQRARQDKERLQNEATTFKNNILPRAKGEAEKILQEAEGYSQRIVKTAEGEAKRFNEFYKTYLQQPNVTKKRMYIETMQKVLKNQNKIIMNNKNSSILPYLPLDKINKNNKNKRAQSNKDVK